MIWMILCLCGFLASILVSSLYVWVDWFDAHERVHDCVCYAACILVLPYILVACIFYELFNQEEDE